MKKNSSWGFYALFYHYNKLLKIMRLSLILSVICTLTVGAANSYSQQTKLSMELKNTTLEKVLKEIGKNTEFSFWYSDEVFDTNKKITLLIKDQTVDKILDLALKDQDLKYTIKDKVILIYKATPSTEIQQFKVIGTVIDDVTKEPLPGVNIQVEGTTLGTITDIDGKYTIELPNSNSSLVYSFVGYNTQKVQANAQNSVINVSLVPDVQSLEEVVVVGYGTQKSATLTGSVTELKGKEFIKSPQVNVSNSLAGRTSGVIANNRSGEPGYDGSTFYIRGMSTTGNNDVLIVVDGIPGQIGGLDRLDPNDIASITVLKDASAAVYGSRAANGAILITTKRGSTGKPSLSYSYNQGFSSPTRLPEMADAATYAILRNEIEYYNNKSGGMNQVYSEADIQKYRDGSDPLNYPNTDWQSEVLKKVALQSQHNLSISGGTTDLKYFVSLGTLHQEGIYKKGVTDYKQYNIRANVDANITKRLKVGVNLSGREEDRKYPINSAGNIFRSIYRAYPNVAAYYPNGLPSTGIENNNPAIMATDMGGTIKNPTYIMNGSLRLNYAIPYIDGLSIEGMVSVDKSFNFSKNFNKPYTLYSYNRNTDAYTGVLTGGSSGKARLDESQTNQTLVTTNYKLDYQKQLGKNNINAFVIYEQSSSKEEKMTSIRYNYPTIETPELSQGGSAAADKDNSGSSYEFARKSYIGKVAYNYAEKYLLEAQFRIDGSSIFPDGEQYGFFPSVSAGWRISEEGWFKNNVSFIDNLKFRVSYGVLGNDNVKPFQYFNNYTFANNYVIGTDIHPGIDLIKLANPAITWEESKKTDIGFNINFLKNFSAEFVYFKQERSDILTARNASIPNVSGIVNPYSSDPLVPSENIGKVNNKGFEASLGYNKQAGNFSYNIGANITYAKSEIIDIDEAEGLPEYQKETGGPLNSRLLYNAIGIFRTQEDLDKYPHLSNAQLGDLIYEDYDKNGSITANDKIRSKYGKVPEITYGINMGASWKNIDFSMVFAGQTHVSTYVLPESGTVGNFYSSWADNRWSPNNVNGSYPRVDTRASSSINGGLYENTFWLNNSAFLRLKNTSLGYTLPDNLISKLKLTKVRIYVSAFNLFTITKVKDYDPEGDADNSGQFYPQQRIFNFGVNVNF
jgi:TonB-linked SusC/RagA family outer membrane protein